MAVYHLSARDPIARSAGRSATAAAAYRAAALIMDDRTGEVFDYSRRKGVLMAALILPGSGPAPDRAQFWNCVEAHHRRGDAVLAREVIVALPAELNVDQRAALAESLGREIADHFGVAVDMALHAPSKRGGNNNWHAHFLLSACTVDRRGALGKKAVLLDPIHCRRARVPDSVTWLRPRWEELANAALAAAGCDQRVDHRSNLTRGIAALPTVHEGVGPGADVRRRINARRRAANADGVALDTEMAALLRERAAAAAKQKIADARADAATSTDADATQPPVHAVPSELRVGLTDLTEKRAEAAARLAELVSLMTTAIPQAMVQEAQRQLPAAKGRAADALRTIALLAAELDSVRWWRPWSRRSAISKRHSSAEREASRLLRELVEYAAEAAAPAYEQIRAEQWAVSAELRRLDQKIGGIAKAPPETDAICESRAAPHEIKSPTPSKAHHARRGSSGSRSSQRDRLVDRSTAAGC